MRRLFSCLVLAVVPAAIGQVGSTAIYTEFEDQPPDAVVESMQAEVASIMSPGGLHFEWRSLSRVSGSEVFTELAVARFKGRCKGENVEPGRFESGALAWSHISDGEVLPFTDVDCDRIGSFLKARLLPLDEKTRETVFGRAIGRVLAHELFHIFTRSKGHGSRNVDKPYYSVAELVSDDFEAGKEFHILAARPKDVASQTRTNASPRDGRVVYAQSGCGNCHGSEGQGSKGVPGLRIVGRWIDAVVLAARLETRGPKMAKRAKQMKVAQPSLAEEDIAELVRFLNALE